MYNLNLELAEHKATKKRFADAAKAVTEEIKRVQAEIDELLKDEEESTEVVNNTLDEAEAYAD